MKKKSAANSRPWYMIKSDPKGNIKCCRDGGNICHTLTIICTTLNQVCAISCAS